MVEILVGLDDEQKLEDERFEDERILVVVYRSRGKFWSLCLIG